MDLSTSKQSVTGKQELEKHKTHTHNTTRGERSRAKKNSRAISPLKTEKSIFFIKVNDLPCKRTRHGKGQTVTRVI